MLGLDLTNTSADYTVSMMTQNKPIPFTLDHVSISQWLASTECSLQRDAARMHPRNILTSTASTTHTQLLLTAH